MDSLVFKLSLRHIYYEYYLNRLFEIKSFCLAHKIPDNMTATNIDNKIDITQLHIIKI